MCPGFVARLSNLPRCTLLGCSSRSPRGTGAAALSAPSAAQRPRKAKQGAGRAPQTPGGWARRFAAESRSCPARSWRRYLEAPSSAPPSKTSWQPEPTRSPERSVGDRCLSSSVLGLRRSHSLSRLPPFAHVRACACAHGERRRTHARMIIGPYVQAESRKCVGARYPSVAERTVAFATRRLCSTRGMALCPSGRRRRECGRRRWQHSTLGSAAGAGEKQQMCVGAQVRQGGREFQVGRLLCRAGRAKRRRHSQCVPPRRSCFDQVAGGGDQVVIKCGRDRVGFYQDGIGFDQLWFRLDREWTELDQT